MLKNIKIDRMLTMNLSPKRLTKEENVQKIKFQISVTWL